MNCKNDAANGPIGRSTRRPVEFRDRVEVVDPCLLRANKYLPAWHQFISLAQRSSRTYARFVAAGDADEAAYKVAGEYLQSEGDRRKLRLRARRLGNGSP